MSARQAAAISLLGLLALAACIPDGVAAGDAPAAIAVRAPDAGIAKAWRMLRAVECARCHGKDYDGLAAPSIVGYAATQSREMFDRIILDGDPSRGMPGYRNNAYVAEGIDDIYRYFLARARGDIGVDYRAPAVVDPD
jgi:mono/diheme cytochrome c family protein